MVGIWENEITGRCSWITADDGDTVMSFPLFSPIYHKYQFFPTPQQWKRAAPMWDISGQGNTVDTQMMRDGWGTGGVSNLCLTCNINPERKQTFIKNLPGCKNHRGVMRKFYDWLSHMSTVCQIPLHDKSWPYMQPFLSLTPFLDSILNIHTLKQKMRSNTWKNKIPKVLIKFLQQSSDCAPMLLVRFRLPYVPSQDYLGSAAQRTSPQGCYISKW